jgi:fatty-acyl-CoA synthase
MMLTDSHWRPTDQPTAPSTTIGDALATAAQRWPHELALVEGLLEDSARRWTFTELQRDAVLVAGTLLDHFEPGDRVAIWSSNRPEWILVQLGAALAGLTLVTVNPAYGEHELTYVLEQSRAHGVVVEPVSRGRDLLEAAGMNPYLLTHPWNKDHPGRRVSDLQQFADIVEEHAREHAL